MRKSVDKRAINHIGMCCPKGYGFWAFLAEKWVHTLCPFWSGIEYGFRGNYGMYACRTLFQK